MRMDNLDLSVFGVRPVEQVRILNAHEIVVGNYLIMHEKGPQSYTMMGEHITGLGPQHKYRAAAARRAMWAEED